jgi:hypothetical protein
MNASGQLHDPSSFVSEEITAVSIARDNGWLQSQSTCRGIEENPCLLRAVIMFCERLLGSLLYSEYSISIQYF